MEKGAVHLGGKPPRSEASFDETTLDQEKVAAYINEKVVPNIKGDSPGEIATVDMLLGFIHLYVDGVADLTDQFKKKRVEVLIESLRPNREVSEYTEQALAITAIKMAEQFDITRNSQVDLTVYSATEVDRFQKAIDPEGTIFSHSLSEQQLYWLANLYAQNMKYYNPYASDEAIERTVWGFMATTKSDYEETKAAFPKRDFGRNYRDVVDAVKEEFARHPELMEQARQIGDMHDENSTASFEINTPSNEALRFMDRIDPDHVFFSNIGEDEIRGLLDLYGRLSPLAAQAETSKKHKKFLDEVTENTHQHLQGNMWTSLTKEGTVNANTMSVRYNRLVRWLREELQRINNDEGTDIALESEEETVDERPAVLEALNLSALENHFGIAEKSGNLFAPKQVLSACDVMTGLISKAEERDTVSLKYDMQATNAPSKEQLSIVWNLIRGRINRAQPLSRDEFVEGYRRHHSQGINQVLVGKEALDRRVEHFEHVVDEAIFTTLQWLNQPEYTPVKQES